MQLGALLVGAAGATAAAALAAFACQSARRRWNTAAKEKGRCGVRVVCISDTHGRHRDLDMPAGDVLIHAGDYTHFGKQGDAEDLNEWFRGLPYKHIFVVEGNHESNAPWAAKASSILSNAVHLKDASATVVGPRGSLKVHGSRFYWPLHPSGQCINPYDTIPSDADVVVVHGPPEGRNDAGTGCASLLRAVRRVDPAAVVSGHIHQAYGVVSDVSGTIFVNAANCQRGYQIGNAPVVLDL